MKYLLVALLTVSILGCEAFKGPAGTQGEAGKDGVANITTKTFTISSDEASIQDGIVINQIEMPEITEDVYNGGDVRIYIDAADLWMALPWTISYDFSDDFEVDQTVELNYAYEEGYIYIIHISSYSGSFFTNDFKEGPYKAIIIPPSENQSKLKPSTDHRKSYKHLFE